MCSFIQVRNQGHGEAQEVLSYDQLEKQEAAYFASVPGLQGPDVQCLLGLPALSQELLKIQEETLKKFMPDFICQVSCQSVNLCHYSIHQCSSKLCQVSP